MDPFARVSFLWSCPPRGGLIRSVQYCKYSKTIHAGIIFLLPLFFRHVHRNPRIFVCHHFENACTTKIAIPQLLRHVVFCFSEEVLAPLLTPEIPERHSQNLTHKIQVATWSHLFRILETQMNMMIFESKNFEIIKV